MILPKLSYILTVKVLRKWIGGPLCSSHIFVICIYEKVRYTYIFFYFTCMDYMPIPSQGSAIFLSKRSGMHICVIFFFQPSETAVYIQRGEFQVVEI